MSRIYKHASEMKGHKFNFYEVDTIATEKWENPCKIAEALHTERSNKSINKTYEVASCYCSILKNTNTIRQTNNRYSLWFLSIVSIISLPTRQLFRIGRGYTSSVVDFKSNGFRSQSRTKLIWKMVTCIVKDTLSNCHSYPTPSGLRTMRC